LIEEILGYNKEGIVKCPICGVEFKSLSNHIKLHNLTSDDFNKQFPTISLTNPWKSVIVPGYKIGKVEVLKIISQCLLGGRYRKKVLCRCSCGKEYETFDIYLLRAEGMQCERCFRRSVFKIGKKYDKLTIIGFKSSDTAICKCDCGNIINKRLWLLRINQTNNCGCDHNGKWKGYKGLTYNYLTRIKRGAKARNLKVEVSLDDIVNLYYKQNGKCALSGVDVKLAERIDDFTASLDRIDSNKHYIKKNIQWIHKDLNIIKSNMNQHIFIQYCKDVYNYKRKKNKENPIKTSDVNMTGTCFYRVKYNATVRSIEFSLTKEYLVELFAKQGGRCCFTGEPLILAESRKSGTASLDRIDSLKGYVEGNVQWVHKRINLMKWDFSQEEFLNWCFLVAKKFKDD
jgi:hypothetical protein